MCMWFEYNPLIIFCYFFYNLNIVPGILIMKVDGPTILGGGGGGRGFQTTGNSRCTDDSKMLCY